MGVLTQDAGKSQDGFCRLSGLFRKLPLMYTHISPYSSLISLVQPGKEKKILRLSI